MPCCQFCPEIFSPVLSTVFSLTAFGCLVLSCILSVVYISGAWSSFVSFLVSVSHWCLFALLLLRPCLTEVFWYFFFLINSFLFFRRRRLPAFTTCNQRKKGIESLMSSLAKFRGTKDKPLCQKNRGKKQSWNTWEWPLRGYNFHFFYIWSNKCILEHRFQISNVDICQGSCLKTIF